MTLGSLFSGSGSFELAGAINGIVPVWASEVEPYPIAVTTSRFPHMKHLGSVTDVKGDNVDPVDVISFGSPCFPAGALVLTDKGNIPIENIKVGMKVLTHKGRWKTVTAVGGKMSETILLKGNHFGQELTKNHPVYSADVQRYYPVLPGKKIGNKRRLVNEGKWTPAGEMLGKQWAVPNHMDQQEIPELTRMSEKCNDIPNMDEDFFYFVGRWLGDGWTQNFQRSNRPSGQTSGKILVCCAHAESDDLYQKLIRVFPHVTMANERTVTKLIVTNRSLCEWLISQFGVSAHGKHLPAWVYSLPIDYRMAMLKGIIDSDGYRQKNGVVKITAVSKALAIDLRLLGETLGFDTTVYFTHRKPTTVIEGRTVHQRNSYTTVLTESQRKYSIRKPLHTWYTVRKMEKMTGEKPVFNLSVEDDNSYVADGIIVHNCQDVSVAGKQAGLHEGKRSSLFFEAIRIIREMRCATHGQYPRFAVFENVPGLFSSAKGGDFRAVLQAFIDLSDDTLFVPEPPKGKWLHAGEIVGDHFSLAWRVQGAEHWGVPQRRNRIYLVVDFGGQCAGKVLFEQDSLRRHSSEGKQERENIASHVERSVGGSCESLKGTVKCQTPWDHQSKRIFDAGGIFPTLPAGEGGGQNDQAIVYDTGACVCNESGRGYWTQGFGCLRAEGEDRPSRPGHLVCFAQNQRDEVRDLGDQAGSLAANPGMKQQSYLAYALQGNGIDRADTAGCNGCGWKANVSYTLNTIDRHAVCYQDTVGALCAADWRGPNSQYVGSDKLVVDPLCTDARGNGEGNVCSTITGDHENRITDYTNIITYGGDKAGTLDASYYKGAGARNGKEREFIAECHSGRKYIVRRLSTTECARLQGLPDCWAIPIRKDSMTDEEAAFWEKVRETQCAIKGTRYKPYAKREQLIGWYNRLRTDSAEYKLYGNGIALPCAAFVLRGIAMALQREANVCE